jgi:drug/metabolite transporter (DMT)-like permease
MRYAGIGRVAALALLWGSGFYWIKLSLRGLTPTQVLFARLALGAAALLFVLYSRRESLPTGGRSWWHLTVAAIFGNVIPYLLFAIAEQDVDSAVAGMLNATTPLWTVMIALAARHSRRPGVRQIVGLILGMVGTVLIFAPWTAGTQFASRGAVLCLLAAFSYGISYVYISRYLADVQAGPLALSAGQLLVATGCSAVILPLFGGLQVPDWRFDALVSVVILGVLGTGLAYLINYRIITDDGAIAASFVVYLLPAVAVVLGALALDEQLTWHALTGVLVVLFGVAAARRSPAPETRHA